MTNNSQQSSTNNDNKKRASGCKSCAERRKVLNKTAKTVFKMGMRSLNRVNPDKIRRDYVTHMLQRFGK